MDTRGQSRAAEAQTECEDQPQLAIAAKIAELRQVVQQQAELMQKQAEEAREREEELARRQNQLFEAFIQRFPVPQDGNRPSPTVEYVRQFDHLSQYAPDMVHTENVSLGTSDGLKEVLRPCPLQVVGSQRSGKRFGFQIRGPSRHNKFSGRGGKPQTGGKRKNGPGNQGQLEQFEGNKQARRSFEQWLLYSKRKRRHLSDCSDPTKML